VRQYFPLSSSTHLKRDLKKNDLIWAKDSRMVSKESAVLSNAASDEANSSHFALSTTRVSFEVA